MILKYKQFIIEIVLPIGHGVKTIRKICFIIVARILQKLPNICIYQEALDYQVAWFRPFSNSILDVIERVA